MRKTFLFYSFLWCIIAGMMFTTLGQDTQVSNLRAPVDGKIVNPHWTLEPTPSDVTTGYAHSTSNNQLVSLPLPGGTPLTIIGAQAYADFAGGGCFGGDGLFYVSTVGNSTGQAAIWIQDITTGAATLVGQTGTGADGFNGIAYDHTTGTYYGVTGTDLYTFNNATGVATYVGPLNNTGGLAIDIAVDCAGNMYMHDLGLDNIYSVDKATGNATLIGSTGFNANYGQGMGYDHDAGVLYLFAFNQTTFTAQLMTVDVTTGLCTVVTDYGLDQHAPFDGQAGCGPPCPVGQATNPNPADGATDVSINLTEVTWTNGSGATSIEVWFDGVSVYSGPPVTSYAIPGPLVYNTTYSWRVDGSDGSCTTYGANWSFTTMADPNLVVVTDDFYPMNVAYWTGTTNGTTKTDDSEVRGLDAEDGWFMFDISSIPAGATVTECTFTGTVNATNWPYWSATPLPGLNPLTATAAELKAAAEANSGDGTAYIYSNESSGFTPGTYTYPTEVWTLTDLTAAIANGWFAMGMDSRDNSTTYYIEWDGWNQAGVPYLTITYEYVIPVELTSFAANVNGTNVTLNWSTATETNNQGFEVQRSSNGSEFVKVGYVAGHGTVTETMNYSYTDRALEVGSYSYRLKQVDFDGSFEFSPVVDVEVGAPDVYSLSQNYPNPFNPSTIIEFNLAADSKVTLTVFDVLGQEVAQLVNGNLAAGTQEVSFDASALNSGVYFYRIDATGVDGTNFSSIKKMILTK